MRQIDVLGVHIHRRACRLGAADAERVYGPDILLALCERTRSSGVRHFPSVGVSASPSSFCTRQHSLFSHNRG